MSTRSNIAIRVKESDFDNVNAYIAKRVSNPDGVVDAEHPYLMIYCHFDGYVSGVGSQLRKDFNDYDKALMLVLRGGCSTPYEHYTSRGESYEDNYPNIMKEPECCQEYLYVFEDDKWTVSTYELEPEEYEADREIMEEIEEYNSAV